MLHITDIQNVVQCKLKGGSRMYPATITKEGARLYVDWRGFSDELRLEIKAMDGHKYHGFDEVNPRKIWSVADNPRNRFQLAYLAHPGRSDPDNPYHLYDKPLGDYQAKRSVYSHQLDFIRHFLTRHYCIVGGEMGTGKTLVAIEGIEQSGVRDWIWVGPKSALVSVKLEFKLWKCDITPRFFTYDGLKKWITEWVPGTPAPQGVVFDESSRLKNWTAQRTQAARHLANAIRTEWGVKGFVVEMSGTPAPKNPVDWWSQCEIAQPGFVREGTVQKFERRLAIVETRLAFEGGGSYPHRVSWRDDERKCDVCGLFKEAETHDDKVDVHQASSTCHKFVPSVNEVAKLSKRLNGLVMVKFKKDCVDLPAKVYKEIQCKPTRSMLNAASAISASASSTIKALTLLRELSDGFQYEDTATRMETCRLCEGRRIATQWYDRNDPDNMPEPEEFEDGHRRVYTGEEDPWGVEIWTRGKPIDAAQREVACYSCSGTGEVVAYTREAKHVPTPKEDALRDIMDEHDDVGRLVTYAGFQASIDRICTISQNSKWHYIRVDGRGWHTNLPVTKPEDMVTIFQKEQIKFPRVMFNGQPGSAGMGLTLTASPTIVYYSNDFNGESRIQSEDRIHRLGMNKTRGATIVDLLCLPSDTLVLNNLKKKKRLQDMSMGELKSLLAAAEQELERSL